MKCTKCGNNNSDDAQFCSKCGTALRQVCPKCGTQIEKDDKFCKKCGAELHSPKKKSAKEAYVKSEIESKPIVEKETQSPKKKKKVPVWLIMVLSILIVLCGLTAIFGDISFSIGAQKATETATMPATLEAIVLSTATSAATETPAPTPTPTYPMMSVSLYCSPEIIQLAQEHQPVRLIAGWAAKTEAQVQEFIDTVEVSLLFDDTDFSSNIVFSPITLDEENNYYYSEYGFDSDPLPVGVHVLDLTITFPFQVSDGDSIYGPGTDTESLNSQCLLLVGAPTEEWPVLVETDFSQEKGVVNNSQGQTEYFSYDLRESDMGVFKASVSPLDATPEDYMISMFHPIVAIPSSQDAIITFDTYIAEQSALAEYGIALRVDDQGRGYYLSIDPATQNVTFYVIYSDQSEILILFNGQVTNLLPDDVNQITFMANGATFAAWLNNNFIFMVEDTSISTSGSIEFILDAAGPGTTTYEFDNLLIRSPIQ